MPGRSGRRPLGATDTANLATRLRERCLDTRGRRVLLSRIAGSSQIRDLSLPPNCGGLGRIRHFRSKPRSSWPINPLPGLPAARWLNTEFRPLTRAQVFQVSGCSYRCWYCYVPYRMLSGNEAVSEWLSPDEMIDRYVAETDRPQIIDLSGGSPDLVPEWIAWTMDALESRGLATSVYLWSDDNLSSDLLVSTEMRSLLRRIEQYAGYGRVCCLKGFDAPSFAFSTGVSEEEFSHQLRRLKSYLATSMDLYGYITLACPPGRDHASKIRRLMDELQATQESFVERLVPLRIERFSTMVARLDSGRREALKYQDDLVEIWLEELSLRSVRPIWSDL
jgi:uncharacterized Fe-S cluster-containing radical SAM superfamily protein